MNSLFRLLANITLSTWLQIRNRYKKHFQTNRRRPKNSWAPIEDPGSGSGKMKRAQINHNSPAGGNITSTDDTVYLNNLILIVQTSVKVCGVQRVVVKKTRWRPWFYALPGMMRATGRAQAGCIRAKEGGRKISHFVSSARLTGT